jgi:hypothetical protein
MRKVKAEYPQGSGKIRDAVSVDVVAQKEPWTEYELEDGSIVKVRTVLLDCLRIDDEYDNDGNPVYMLKANGTMSVTAPDSLRQKKQ